jgi:hypothetical protein
VRVGGSQERERDLHRTTDLAAAYPTFRSIRSSPTISTAAAPPVPIGRFSTCRVVAFHIYDPPSHAISGESTSDIDVSQPWSQT